MITQTPGTRTRRQEPTLGDRLKSVKNKKAKEAIVVWINNVQMAGQLLGAVQRKVLGLKFFEGRLCFFDTLPEEAVEEAKAQESDNVKIVGKELHMYVEPLAFIDIHSSAFKQVRLGDDMAEFIKNILVEIQDILNKLHVS